jgi:hypothetical protein
MAHLMRRVRAAMALATLSGADSNERCGSKCNSASHITSSPRRSPASTCSMASSKASLSLLPGSDGNSWNMPNSMTLPCQVAPKRRRSPAKRAGAGQV